VRWLPLLAGVLSVAVVPELRWRRWRWDVRPEAIDVRHGALTVRRTLVPMERVQHVDTRRGVLEQSFGLATVEVHTAADSHTIPLLSVPDADEVRDRIAALARTADAT
jgi:membrane protein YdbS with pleckstrin-like domain